VDLLVPFLAGLAALAAHPEAGHSPPLASDGVLRAIGRANRVGVREDQVSLPRFAI